MVDVAGDVHEDVDRRESQSAGRGRDSVAEVDENFCPGAGQRALVVDAAGAVGDVPENSHARSTPGQSPG